MSQRALKKKIISKGTIIEIDFPYVDDFSRSKKRPGLVLWSDKESNSFLIAFITSNLSEPSEGDFIIKKSDKGFNKTGLIKDSRIKLTKLITLSRDRISAKFGILPEETIKKINKELIKVLKL